MTLFAAAAGSITGRSHRLAERDGQDGSAIVASADVTAVVVTDGCSSGRSSEVGARIGAEWLAAIITRRFRGEGVDPRAAADETCAELVDRLRLLARSMNADGDLDAAKVGDVLLFGFLAAVVTREHAIVFGIGDGTVFVNGEITVIDPGPQNAPPYAAYALLGSRVAPRIHYLARASDAKVLAIATDGVAPPKECVHALADTKRIDVNPSLLRKKLLVLANEHRFADDATIGVIRRVESTPGEAAS